MPKSTHSYPKKPRQIYLDYAASINPNPSSIHFFGINAKKKLENARKEVGKVLSARADEIIFTSGGTESNNLAIQGVVFSFWEPSSQMGARLPKIPHIITTNIEHASVLETFKLLAKRKLAQISIIPVEKNGIIDPKKIKKTIKKNTILVSVNYANNEIGTIQPIKEIAKEIKHWKNFPPGERCIFPLLHIDAVQAANYLDLDVKKLQVDLLTLSGSKIEGAGKIGVLYKKKSVRISPLFGGGDQEFGLRPGTENLPEILKFGKALQLAEKIKEKEAKRLIMLRDYFFEQLQKMSKTAFDIMVNGDLKNRLPNNINITIPNIPSDLLVIELSGRGIMASAKSACHSGDGKVSYVIKAINPNIKEEDGSLRFSLGRQTTKKDIDYTIKALSEILTKLKKWYN